MLSGRCPAGRAGAPETAGSGTATSARGHAAGSRLAFPTTRFRAWGGQPVSPPRDRGLPGVGPRNTELDRYTSEGIFRECVGPFTRSTPRGGRHSKSFWMDCPMTPSRKPRFLRVRAPGPSPFWRVSAWRWLFRVLSRGWGFPGLVLVVECRRLWSALVNQGRFAQRS